jgi:hypothetical protein
MKTMLKPIIKLTVLAIGFGVFSSVMGEPPMMHSHEGISGNTHGDKKDNNPAQNASKTFGLSIIIIENLPFYTL